MSLFSIFSNKPTEATSVAEALAGAPAPAKAKSRRSENRRESAEDQQLIPEKKRARRRLIGAVAIVLAVVIGLPMVLDSEPKPLSKNIVIQIPSKDAAGTFSDAKEVALPEETSHPGAALPLPPPVETAPLSSSVAAETETSPKPVKAESPPAAKHASDSAVKKEPVKSKPEPRTDSKPVAKTENKTDSKVADKHATTSDDSARAMAILGGADTAAGSTQKAAGKIVLQVGAFATQEKVSELQSKLSAAGIKSFTQKVATSTGDKIRVRVGPFADHESAVKMKSQLDKLGINSTLISL